MENKMRIKTFDDRGSIMFVALILLTILSILGVSISKVANTDILISRHEGVTKNYFYVVEGGRQREAQEIGSGSYPVSDIYTAALVQDSDVADTTTPSPATPHTVRGVAYDFTVGYEGAFIPPKGYSATDFSRYDYGISTSITRTGKMTGGKARVRARYYTIGPKAN